MEIFAIKIRNCNSIHGINILNNEIKISQYADDTVLFLEGTSESLSAALDVITAFRSASGLKVNIDKSFLFPLGYFVRMPPPFVNDLQLTIAHGPIRYLGIYFNHNNEDFFALNYQPKLSRLKSILGMWSTRDLTPIGKITIIKSLVLSDLVYLFSVLPNPVTPHFVIIAAKCNLNAFCNTNRRKM